MERRLGRRRFVAAEQQRVQLGAAATCRPSAPPVVVCRAMNLEAVLGLCVQSRAALSCDVSSGTVAYPVGSTVVLYHGKSGRRSFVHTDAKRAVSSVAFSPDGRYLATGEGGHEPLVRVWEVATLTQLTQFKGHKHGVSCVEFSPGAKYVVSVGNQHDSVVNVWNWRQGVKVAANKISNKVHAVSFAESGQYFVSAGVRHVKFWYVERTRPAAAVQYQDAAAVPLQGRSAILADQRNNSFVDVACGRGASADKTFAVTQTGLLCEFNARRLLERWLDFRTPVASALALGDGRLFVTCADGLVRAFDARSLAYVGAAPRPHPLGADVAAATSAAALAAARPANAAYPHALAICFHEPSRTLTCVYADHSLYQWDLTDMARVGKLASHLYHAGCAWAVEAYPAGVAEPRLPDGAFVTCGADDTIRFWSIDAAADAPSVAARPNIYSAELLKVLYLGDGSLSSLTDANAPAADRSADNVGQYDGRNGVKCIRLSADGQHVASGDRMGNVRVHDLATMELISAQEAHDNDVLCLEYSPPGAEDLLLASGGRDRLLHLFDARNDYQPVATIDDHSSSIVAVRFSAALNPLRMLSCGADKTIIFRVYQPDQAEIFERINLVVAPSSLSDMQMDAAGRSVFVASQDRKIRSYSVAKAKAKRSVKGSSSDDGALIKLALDDSGALLATSCSDKTVAVVETRSGEPVAALPVFSELITGLAFSADGRRLITVAGDGAVCVWRFGAEVAKALAARASLRLGLAGDETPVDAAALADADETTSQTTDSASLDDDSLAPSTARSPRRLRPTVPTKPFALLPLGVQTDMSPRGEADGASVVEPAHASVTPTPTSDRAAVIYMNGATEGPVGSENDSFEVKARADELRRSASAKDIGTPMLYRGSDTLGSEMSDDDGDSTTRSERRGSASMMNAGGAVRPARKTWGSAMRVTAPVAAAALSPSSDAGGFERGSADRDSLSRRFLTRRSHDQDSLPSPSSSVASEQNRTWGHYRLSGSKSSVDISQTLSRPLWHPSSATPSNRGRTPPWQYRAGNRRISGLFQRSSTPETQTAAADDSTAGFSLRQKSAGKLARDKRRRLTMPDMFLPDLLEDDYVNSDLHSRSRSQSPLTASRNGRYASAASDMDDSRGPRRAAGAPQTPTTPRRSNDPTDRRLSDVRAKLRQSQENLGLTAAGERDWSPSSHLATRMSRSRSIGSLQQQSAATTPVDERPLATPTLAHALGRSRELARSLGNLRAAAAAPDERSPTASRPLAETIGDLKRLSSQNLSPAAEPSPQPTAERPMTGAYYERSQTLPRQKRGAVQRKAETARHHRLAGLERASASGDSDSDRSPVAAAARRPQPSSHAAPSRLSSTSGAEDSAASSTASALAAATATRMAAEDSSGGGSVDRPAEMPRPGHLQAARRVFESSGGAAKASRRHGSYLAAKMAQMDEPGPDLHPARVDDAPASPSPDAQKLNRHVADCLEQFQASLDKVMHAYNVVNEEPELSATERDGLRRALATGLAAAQRRLQQLVGAPDGAAPSEPERQQLPAALQQYSELLVQMIQQNLTQGAK